MSAVQKNVSPGDAPEPQSPSAGDGAVDKVVDALEKATLQDDTASQGGGGSMGEGSTVAARPFKNYSQGEVLFLRKSPLVRPPKGMPALKDWFGDWNEQSSGKKDAEPSTTTSTTRDRRFRRDQEDGEPPPRATFRSTLSQPSQMGNFKHQSIRTSDREKDKDGDKDKERDTRDREGQERLRNLSEKYDRDRLATPPANGLRTRDRDSAPHLAAGTSRLATQSTLATGTSRRAEGRESTRRKPGESSEDWRRGRDDRSEPLRRDRDDRPRSRARDSSRQRHDTSPPLRRDRDRDDRDRDELRRPREEHSRRDRDVDRETNDDSRRWRDDGKREERLAARRELRDREYRERDKDRPARSGSEWDAERPRGDRWTPADERDSRSKRVNGRDKRAGSGDEGEGRSERRDRDHRDKEKEPAWMDTYIPSDSGGGILGGKTADGELDGIQAWKKGMKEREQKEQATEASREQAPNAVEEPESKPAQAGSKAEPPMDEIQMFKLMIKREEERSKQSSPSGSPPDPAPSASANQSSTAGVLQGLLKPSSAPVVTLDSLTSNLSPQAPPAPPSLVTPSVSTISAVASGTPQDGMRSVFSNIPPASSMDMSFTSNRPSAKPTTPSLESPKTIGSRFFPNPSPSDTMHNQNQLLDRNPTNAIKSPIPAQFHPPPGSRLLAFGSRTPSATSSNAKASGLPDQYPGFGAPQQTPDMSPAFSSDNMSRFGSESDMMAAQLRGVATGRAQPGYSPFANQGRQNMYVDEGDGFVQSETLRRQSLATLGERQHQFPSPSDSASPYSDLGGSNQLGLQSNYPPASHSPSYDPSGDRGQGGSPYPPPKGSRFAKFFDGKPRDAQSPNMGNNMGGHGQQSYQRHDMGAGEPYGANTEPRTMEDLFAMLQSSTQSQRALPVNSQGAPLNNGLYAHNHPNQHAHHQLQNLQSARNQELLYDNRLDDRNFVPDGMVPGLRSVPPPRRENTAMYHDQLDDQMAFNVQPRLPPQRGVDLYPGPVPSLYAQQSGVPRGLPLQQQPYRNGSSPIANPNPMHAPPQRLPPGLANLGGRPPHEPNQFLGSLMGMGAGGGQGNGQAQQAYNNFPGGNGLGYQAGPQLRGPPLTHQVQNPLGPNPIPVHSHPNKIDLRGQNQAQLLGLGNGLGGGGGGLRGPAVAFAPQQGAPMHAPHLAMRQQQLLQQQLPPQSMSHLLPPHMQGPPGGGAQDLMALLLQGQPRE